MPAEGVQPGIVLLPFSFSLLIYHRFQPSGTNQLPLERNLLESRVGARKVLIVSKPAGGTTGGFEMDQDTTKMQRIAGYYLMVFALDALERFLEHFRAGCVEASDDKDSLARLFSSEAAVIVSYLMNEI